MPGLILKLSVPGFTITLSHFFQNKLSSMGQEPKALLALKSCSPRPDEEQLLSSDGKVKALFLPLNVMSLIQPMDQGVI